MNRPLAILPLASSWILFISLHWLAVHYSLYWYFAWFDIFMHAYGGYLVVATVYKVRQTGAFPNCLAQKWFHPLILVWVVMIGWELFELYFGLIDEQGYLIDTLADFGNGFGGGLVAFLVQRSRTIHKQ